MCYGCTKGLSAKVILFIVQCCPQAYITTPWQIGCEYIFAYFFTTEADPWSVRWLNRFCKQELSYRKQIARQLHTQYVEGIYDNSVTLSLRVTQGHWKRNHWVDHTISRVI